jgi:hypothetical protein
VGEVGGGEGSVPCGTTRTRFEGIYIYIEGSEDEDDGIGRPHGRTYTGVP